MMETYSNDDSDYEKQTVDNAIQEGNVPKLKPKVWHSTKSPGNDKEHPAPVIRVSEDRKTATVVQLTHHPIRDQWPIKTKLVAPSMARDIEKNGTIYPSVSDLNCRDVKIANIKKEHGDDIISVRIDPLPPHELESLRTAAELAPLKVEAGACAAAAAKKQLGEVVVNTGHGKRSGKSRK